MVSDDGFVGGQVNEVRGYEPLMDAPCPLVFGTNVEGFFFRYVQGRAVRSLGRKLRSRLPRSLRRLLLRVNLPYCGFQDCQAAGAFGVSRWPPNFVAYSQRGLACIVFARIWSPRHVLPCHVLAVRDRRQRVSALGYRSICLFLPLFPVPGDRKVAMYAMVRVVAVKGEDHGSRFFSGQ